MIFYHKFVSLASILLAILLFPSCNYPNADQYNSNAAQKKNNQEDYFFKKDIQSIRAAAEKGNSEAQFRLATCCLTGQDAPMKEKEIIEWVEQRSSGNNDISENEAEGVDWLQKAAQKENVKALTLLGVCYLKGVGVSRDETEAVKWLHKAADKGNSFALYTLALCYFEGKGAPQDEKEGIELFRKAANKGYVYAQWELGKCYLEGRGVPQDNSKGCEWIRKAKKQGYYPSDLLPDDSESENADTNVVQPEQDVENPIDSAEDVNSDNNTNDVQNDDLVDDNAVQDNNDSLFDDSDDDDNSFDDDAAAQDAAAVQDDNDSEYDDEDDLFAPFGDDGAAQDDEDDLIGPLEDSDNVAPVKESSGNYDFEPIIPNPEPDNYILFFLY